MIWNCASNDPFANHHSLLEVRSMHVKLALFGATAVLLSGCGNAQDKAEDRVEHAAQASAAAAGPAPVALGLSEAQLLDADLVDANNVELGDVQALARDGSGKVDRLLIEIEDSHPDKFVHVPIAGLTTAQRGTDMDVVTKMTKQQLAALPAVDLNAAK
jgi:hypothetical protein